MRIAALLVILAACTSSQPAAPPAPPEPRALIHSSPIVGVVPVEETATWSVHFSPKGGCLDAVVTLIASAKASVRLAGYSFTSQPIANALIAARALGLDVQVVLDRENGGAAPAAGSKAQALKAAGIPVFVDTRHAIFHDKFIVVDGKVLEAGSYNFTAQAETSNAENCFVYRSAAAAKSYSDNWTLHQTHAAPL